MTTILIIVGAFILLAAAFVMVVCLANCEDYDGLGDDQILFDAPALYAAWKRRREKRELRKYLTEEIGMIKWEVKE